MIISFNGDHGSGKSTIAKKVAEALCCPRYYMGQIFRDMAKERGLTLEEFEKICSENPDFDKKVDERVIELAKQSSEFVIESRTAWYFIPDSIKIYLKVDEKEAAHRVFQEMYSSEHRQNEAQELNTKEKVRESLQKRQKNDDERYKKYYGINIREEKNYDLVLDTTNLSVEEVFEKVMGFIKTKLNA